MSCKLVAAISAMNAQAFADRQFELAEQFAQFIAEHPEVDKLLAEKSHVCFQIVGDAEFNRMSREIAQRQVQEDGTKIVTVTIKGLSPVQGSRLIDPVIESAPAVA